MSLSQETLNTNSITPQSNTHTNTPTMPIIADHGPRDSVPDLPDVASDADRRAAKRRYRTSLPPADDGLRLQPAFAASTSYLPSARERELASASAARRASANFSRESVTSRETSRASLSREPRASDSPSGSPSLSPSPTLGPDGYPEPLRASYAAHARVQRKLAARQRAMASTLSLAAEIEQESVPEKNHRVFMKSGGRMARWMNKLVRPLGGDRFKA